MSKVYCLLFALLFTSCMSDLKIVYRVYGCKDADCINYVFFSGNDLEVLCTPDYIIIGARGKSIILDLYSIVLVYIESNNEYMKEKAILINSCFGILYPYDPLSSDNELKTNAYYLEDL